MLDTTQPGAFLPCLGPFVSYTQRHPAFRRQRLRLLLQGLVSHLQGHGQLRVQVGVNAKLKALAATTAAATTSKGGTALALHTRDAGQERRQHCSMMRGLAHPHHVVPQADVQISKVCGCYSVLWTKQPQRCLLLHAPYCAYLEDG